MVPLGWNLPVGVTQSLTSPSSASSSSRLSPGSVPRAPSSACVWGDVLPAAPLPSACSPFVQGRYSCSVPHLVQSQLMLPQYSFTDLPPCGVSPSFTLPDPPPPSCSPEALLPFPTPCMALLVLTLAAGSSWSPAAAVVPRPPVSRVPVQDVHSSSPLHHQG